MALAVRACALLLLSLLLTLMLEMARLPAAPLLGPMAAAILFSARGADVPVPRTIFALAQGVVGVMIAANMPVSVLPEVARDWPIFALGVFSTVVASNTLGFMLARTGALPGTTAIWGSAPGAATAMTLMSEAYGADLRLVAFMQYTRVVACAVASTLVARLVGSAGQGTALPEAAVPAGIAPLFLAAALAAGASLLALRLRLSGGMLLMPLAAGLAVKLGLGLDLYVPAGVQAVSYAIIGLVVGMRFSPDVLRHAARLLPRVLGSILLLIAISAGFALVISRLTGIDPLSAYLATSPGGADTVAIIASSSKVDLPFVMAMQVARFLVVLVAGPFLARFLSRRAGLS